MAFKSFEAAVADKSDAPAFELYGHTFHCVPELPSKVILRFVAASSSAGTQADSDNPQAALQGAQKLLDTVDDFFRRAMLPEDYKVWQAWSDGEDQEHIIGMSTLLEITGWLAGEYSARPTGKNSDNSSSPTSGGDDSTPGAPHKAPTYSRPEQPGPTA